MLFRKSQRQCFLSPVLALRHHHEVKHVLYEDSMSTEERQAALAAFHADVPFLVLQTGSSGVGLNLQVATTVTTAALLHEGYPAQSTESVVTLNESQVESGKCNLHSTMEYM